MLSAMSKDVGACRLSWRMRGVQIFSVSRQVLSLVAGDAIDVFLLGQLRLLREEHTLARLISSIQAALWPGGSWFMSRPEYKVRAVSWVGRRARTVSRLRAANVPIAAWAMPDALGDACCKAKTQYRSMAAVEKLLLQQRVVMGSPFCCYGLDRFCIVQAGAESVRVTPENFMEDRSTAPLDEDEIREALAAALTQCAPPALVRFVGKPAYSR